MILEGYTIGGKLGDGGMATVYKGQQLSLLRPVAIKVLKQNLVDHHEIRKRFEQESLIIAKLNHPNIIHVIDQGITENGMPYFVMEYIKSFSLDAAIKERSMETNRALDIFTQIAKALAYAHKNGVIHRDIKPDNVLVDDEGHVRVVDFGISRFFEGSDSNKYVNEENFVMGTFSYMAPEQKISAENATTLSDIYSLGVVMYQFFSGRLPQPNDIGKIRNIASFNKSIPEQLDALVMECLAANPKHRPENADAVKNRLLMVLQGGHLNAEQHERAQTGVKKSFSLLDVIKEDRWGSVYLFKESKNNSLLCIKKKNRNNKGFKETQKLADLNHRNLVNILGSSRNDRAFILVMDYYEGGTLADRLNRPFQPIEFYPIAIEIAEGMTAAHKADIIHGNLRPTNILFNDAGQVKISDFGLDEHYGTTGDQNWYAIEHEPTSEAVDIYAAGIIFYQMLIGELPKRRHLKLVPTKEFEELPEELQHLLKQMMHLDPTRRPDNFEIIATFLKDLNDNEETVFVEETQLEVPINHSPLKKQPPQQKKKSQPTVVTPKKKKPNFAVIFFVLIFLLVVAAQGYFLTTGDIQDQLKGSLNNLFQASKTNE